MKAKLTKLFTLLTILTLGITNLWGATTTEVYFVKAADNTGTQSTIFTGAPSDGGNQVATFTVDGTEYSSTRRTSNGQFSITFTLPSDKTARLWAVHNQSSRHFTLTGASAITPVTESTGFSVSSGTAYADVFDISDARNYTLSNSANIGLICLILKIEDAGGSGGGEDPVCPSGLSITSKNDKTAFMEGDAIELTASLTAGNGSITYQWYKGGTAEGNKLTGKTAAKLEIASCVEGDAGDYYCVASKSDCSDAVNADAFTITVAHNPCATHHWFVATTDATSNGVTNWNGFTNGVTGSSGQTNSVTIDGTTYSLTKRTGSTGGGGTILGFTIPANKAGTLYGYMKSSGSAARTLSLKKGDDVVKTNTEIVDGNWTLITIDAIAPGTYTLSPDQNVQVQMFVLKVCDATFRTITLEYADGVTADGSLDALDGAPATKPTDPTWAHHRFDGWYNGETPYNWTANVTGDLTLTAHWTQLYTVTYEAGDGTATGDAPTEADKAKTETFTVAANPFTIAGKDFVKWNDGTNDYAPGDTYTVGTDNVVLTAQWKAAADKYTVIFKDGTTELGTKLFDVTTNPSDADIDKTKALNTFAAWQKEGVDIALDDAFWASVAKDAEITLTARWAKAFATSVDLEGLVEASGTGADWQKYLSDHGYAFSTSNVSLDEKKDPSENKPYDNWPYQGLKAKVSGAYVEGNIEAGKLVIIKLGHMAAAATITVDGVAQANATGLDAAEPAGAMNYYYLASEGLLRYETTNAGACILKAITITDPYTVSFDANGGDDVTSLNGTPSVTLPLPVKGTESFLGWFDGETKVGEDGDKYTPTANITLKAHWEAVSTDARLSAITFSSAAGTLAPAFDPEVTEYTYTMPYGTAAIPTITGATAVNANAKTPIIGDAATAWGEAQTIKGVAQSDDKKTYTITMKVAPKDGVCLVWADIPSNNTITYNATKSKYFAESDVTLATTVNGKDGSAPSGVKFQGSTYIHIGGAFLAGDVLALDVTYAANGTNQTMYVYDAQAGAEENIIGTLAGGKTPAGLNEVTLTKDAADLWLVRGGQNSDWNPHVDYVAVYRPMNPVLTAIQFNATDVEVTSTTVAATLPNGTNLSTMTVTPTIVWNGAGTATPTAAWAWGANTYRVTDKDGDYTDYTITLTEAVPAVDPTLTYNEGAYMVGASALDLSTLIDEADSDGEITYTVKTDGGTSATITDGKFTATAAGTATITATQAATVAYNAKTVDFDVVVTEAAEIDGIKMVEAGALTGNFRIKADQLKTGDNTVEGINYTKYVQMGSTHTSFSGETEGTQTKGIYYAPTKKNIKFWFYMRNTESSTTRKIYVYTIEEGKEITSKTVDVEAGSHLVSTDITLTTNAEIVFGVENTKLLFCQIVAVESGDDLLQGGQNGYVFDYSKKRQNVAANTLRTIDGIEYKLSAEAKINSASNVQLQTLGTHYIKFHLDNPMTINVYSDNKKYYIGSECSTEDAAKLYESTGDGEFSLVAGDWYINGADVQVKINKLSFTAPKCAEPVIDAQPASKLDFAAGDMTASVTAHATDGGTLSYQWYKAVDDSEVAGQTTETLTTTEEGTYYVIVTNKLADHSDNFVKSDEATLKYRKADDATLSALTVSEGTLDPIFDPAVLEYNVTLPEGTVDVPTLTATAAMAAYGATADVTNAAAFVNYEATSTVLVTAEDHSTQQTYTVHFYVDHTILALVDVTGDMTWDFSKDGLADGAACGNKTDIIMANVDGVVNNDDFHSDNIMVNANKQAGTKLQASMIMFHTTVDGLIKVVFSNTGDKSSERYLVVNGKKTDSGTKTKTNITYYGFVPAGDVVLTVIEGDGNMLNFASVQFTAKAAADLARDAAHGDDWMAPGELGTVCIPNGAVATGGDLYTLEGKNSDGKIVFATVPNNKMTPGVPYLFQATSNSMKFYYTEEAAVTDPVNTGAMQGTFSAQNLTELDNVYYFAGHALWSCSDLTSLEVKANRAWVDMSKVGSGANPAPGRRYIIMDVHGQNATTDLGNVQGDEVQSTKVLINGQLFILRGEKMYDATGRLVK